MTELNRTCQKNTLLLQTRGANSTFYLNSKSSSSTHHYEEVDNKFGVVWQFY